jgi:two-component system, cell cycle response regulator
MTATENQQLRSQLDELLAQAKRNQDIMRRQQEVELRFVGAENFLELIEAACTNLGERSTRVTATLALLDPDHAIRRLLAELPGNPAAHARIIFMQEEAEYGALLPALCRPTLGPYAPKLHARLFRDPASPPACAAILPLRRGDTLIGSLNLGSADATRFASGMATDFLEHHTSILAVCIENVINKELLKQVGLTDSLTGVRNRHYVEARLTEEVARSCRQQVPLSCLYIDIDHFKRINDQFGHHAGDEVLRQAALRIKAELRLSDAFGRWGGEEFLGLLVDTGTEGAEKIAERIRSAISASPIALACGTPLQVTLSIGIAQLEQADKAIELEQLAQNLVAGADQALYAAKAAGRNRAQVFSG